MEYKKCFVPTCENDSINAPNKLIVKIREDLRQKWCKQANVEYFKIYTMYCCEDHFNPGKDLKNYYSYKKTKRNPVFLPTAKLRYLPSEPSQEDSNEPLLVERNTSPQRDIVIKPTKGVKRKMTSRYILSRPAKIRPKTKSLDDFSRSCRFCLIKKGPMKPIVGSGLDVILTEFMHLEIKENDGYPQSVCIQCIRKLRSLHIFYLTAKNSRKYLDQVAGVEDKQDSINKIKQEISTKSYSVYCQTEENLFIEPKSQEKLPNSNYGYNYKCSQCIRNSRKAQILSHKNAPEQFVQLCDLCGKTFRKRSTLVKHIRVHNDELKERRALVEAEPAVVITTSSEEIVTSVTVEEYDDSNPIPENERPNKSVGNPKPYDCDLCSRAFYNRQALRRHKQNVHAPAEARSMYPCDECERRFHTFYNLKKHCLRMHTPSRCNRCNASFPGITPLELHMKIHKERDLIDKIKAPLQNESENTDTATTTDDHSYAQYIEIFRFAKFGEKGRHSKLPSCFAENG